LGRPGRTGIDPALIVIAAGIGAALHVGKLPPAVTALQAELGLSLVQAGFALSLMQLAGMLLGVAFGALADGLGLQRSMVIGLALLALGSTLGGAATAPALLLATRVIEGLGFLLVVLPAPALLRRWAPPGKVTVVLGLWGAYMPLATALALLGGPLAIAALGWRGWWWALAALCAAMALWLHRTAPPREAAGTGGRGPAPAAATPAAAGTVAVIAAAAGPAPSATAMATAAAAGSARPATPTGWSHRLGATLRAPGPWLVALSFAMYSGQWLAVIGFLPTIYAGAGIGSSAVAVLTAGVAAANIVGNVGAGRWLARGVPAPRLLVTGFVTMALCTVAAFAEGGPAGAGLPPTARYLALVLFSAVGGLIPGTLFSLAVRVAPGPETLATTVGWMQQWSAFGQFAGPPAAAWLTLQVGGWHFTWLMTTACSLLGLALSQALARRLQRSGARTAGPTAGSAP
jgi:MFS family permease